MSQQRPSLLNTFVAPRPKPGLISALVPLNRWLNLYGTPLLRDIPYLNRLPLMRGLCDIHRLEIPEADDAQLKATIATHGCTFITPNHPEFLPTG